MVCAYRATHTVIIHAECTEYMNEGAEKPFRAIKEAQPTIKPMGMFSRSFATILSMRRLMNVGQTCNVIWCMNSIFLSLSLSFATHRTHRSARSRAFDEHDSSPWKFCLGCLAKKTASSGGRVPAGNLVPPWMRLVTKTFTVRSAVTIMAHLRENASNCMCSWGGSNLKANGPDVDATSRGHGTCTRMMTCGVTSEARKNHEVA